MYIIKYNNKRRNLFGVCKKSGSDSNIIDFPHIYINSISNRNSILYKYFGSMYLFIIPMANREEYFRRITLEDKVIGFETWVLRHSFFFCVKENINRIFVNI